MKKTRLICLLLTLGMLAISPQPASAQACCQRFLDFCEGLCNAHQGVSFTDCNVGMSHSDYCWCNDDPGTPIYGDPSGKCVY